MQFLRWKLQTSIPGEGVVMCIVNILICMKLRSRCQTLRTHLCERDVSTCTSSGFGAWRIVIGQN
jgi:hypothetical protein